METFSYASEAGLTLTTPSGSVLNLELYTSTGAFSNFQSYSWTVRTPGTYTLEITDSWGDGGQSAAASYTYLSGSQEAQVTPAGTELDNDDDDDGNDDDDDA